MLPELREANGPISSREITKAWCAERGLRTDDATWAIVRNRIGAVLTTLNGQRLAARAGKMADGYKGWRLVQPKTGAPGYRAAD